MVACPPKDGLPPCAWPKALSNEGGLHRCLLKALPERFKSEGLTPWLTGAGARSAEGTDIGHEDAEGMAYVGVRVEPTVRLLRVVEGRDSCQDLNLWGIEPEA